MTRRKKVSQFKTEFCVQVTDTVFGSKANRITRMDAMTGVAGIGVTVEKRTEDTYIVTTRSRVAELALKDYNFVKRVLSKQFGKILSEQVWMKVYKRNKVHWAACGLEQLEIAQPLKEAPF